VLKKDYKQTMVKKSAKKAYEFLMDGKRASLLEIAEGTGDENVWKSFLERHGLQRRQTVILSTNWESI